MGLAKYTILPGQKFGRLTVLSVFRKAAADGTTRRWLSCRCDCGKLHEVEVFNAVSGRTASCGCLLREATQRRRRLVEGKSISSHPLYRVWACMIGRCSDPKDAAYENYGKRGIAVCKEWMDSFVPFYNWALESGYRRDLTIERKDNNRGYCPENCKFATRTEQARNTRRNLQILAFGELKTAWRWKEDKRCIVPLKLVYERLLHGWTPERALSTPLGPSSKRYSHRKIR